MSSGIDNGKTVAVERLIERDTVVRYLAPGDLAEHRLYRPEIWRPYLNLIRANADAADITQSWVMVENGKTIAAAGLKPRATGQLEGWLYATPRVRFHRIRLVRAVRAVLAETREPVLASVNVADRKAYRFAEWLGFLPYARMVNFYRPDLDEHYLIRSCHGT